MFKRKIQFYIISFFFKFLVYFCLFFRNTNVFFFDLYDNTILYILYYIPPIFIGSITFLNIRFRTIFYTETRKLHFFYLFLGLHFESCSTHTFPKKWKTKRKSQNTIHVVCLERWAQALHMVKTVALTYNTHQIANCETYLHPIGKRIIIINILSVLIKFFVFKGHSS